LKKKKRTVQRYCRLQSNTTKKPSRRSGCSVIANNATVNGKYYVGGIAGANKGKIENNYNTGTISGNSQIGGVTLTEIQ